MILDFRQLHHLIVWVDGQVDLLLTKYTTPHNRVCGCKVACHYGKTETQMLIEDSSKTQKAVKTCKCIWYNHIDQLNVIFHSITWFHRQGLD